MHFGICCNCHLVGILMLHDKYCAACAILNITFGDCKHCNKFTDINLESEMCNECQLYSTGYRSARNNTPNYVIDILNISYRYVNSVETKHRTALKHVQNEYRRKWLVLVRPYVHLQNSFRSYMSPNRLMNWRNLRKPSKLTPILRAKLPEKYFFSSGCDDQRRFTIKK